MRRIAPQTHFYESRFHVVTRSGQRKNAVLTAFLKALEISLTKREKLPPRATLVGRQRAARASLCHGLRMSRRWPASLSISRRRAVTMVRLN